MAKPRVLYCSEGYSPHDHRFLTALAESSFKIYWLRLEEGGRVQESRGLPDSIQRVIWRSDNASVCWDMYPALQVQFEAAVKKINPDLIHAGPIQRVAFLPALIGFHPLLTMSWGFDLLEDACRDVTWVSITRQTLTKSDWFISDCQTTRDIAVSYGMPVSKTTIFPWGVNLELFNPEKRGFMRRQVGFEEDLLIIHTRSWEPRYGVDIALEGFRLALKTEPHLRLFMLGGGSMEEQVKHYVMDNGLAERVHFCGYKQNEALAGYYQAGDVYLSASHIDGSSVALMEAMACGCPPLVSDIPANLEWVSDGKQGWVFKDDDSRQLARHLITISRDRASVKSRGRKAREKAETDADWTSNFAKLIETYDHLINRSKRQSR